jgi:hypothetical protein
MTAAPFVVVLGVVVLAFLVDVLANRMAAGKVAMTVAAITVPLDANNCPDLQQSSVTPAGIKHHA